MHYYTDVLKKYVVFSGRATRSEFWYFVLINLVIVAILSTVAEMLLSEQNAASLLSVYNLAIFLPSLGLAVRRMHDIDKSGWWVLINLIPVVGWIWFIVLAATKSAGGNVAVSGEASATTAAPTPETPEEPMA